MREKDDFGEEGGGDILQSSCICREVLGLRDDAIDKWYSEGRRVLSTFRKMIIMYLIKKMISLYIDKGVDQ